MTQQVPDAVHEDYREPYAAWLANWPTGTPDEPYWPAFADAIDAAREPLVAERARLAEFARWLVSMDAMDTEAGWTLRKTVSLNDIIERARIALGDDETVPPKEPAAWADPHAAAVDEMGADLYLTPRGEIGRYLVGCGDSPLERAFARYIGPVPEGWRRLYVEATAADDSSGKKD